MQPTCRNIIREEMYYIPKFRNEIVESVKTQ